MNVSIETGKAIPDFSCASTDGTFRLSENKGKSIVLYFYPRDNTPACTQEGIDFRDKYEEFQRENVLIVGVSRDSLASHDRFRKKYDFPFHLLSDADEAVCNLFGVMKNKKMYGKVSRGIERSTFLIDSSGTLAKEWRKLQVPGHIDAVLQAVKELHDK